VAMYGKKTNVLRELERERFASWGWD